MRDKHKFTIQKRVTKTLEDDIPLSVKNSITNITDHYDKYMDVMDLDVATRELIKDVFKSSMKNVLLVDQNTQVDDNLS